ncbi:DUF935 family protein [Leptotrichia sp. OH3620_COT-345]|uniref:phage portal protein family protein n=1 Tax=Leptotrichia sp. OH3620_COT-345 TaxID=2491048 RepID=UPI000F6491BE|nr:DUF935 family protein [Leptotrichia sp. OH3620_COT-345]RRD38808.1 DUF935 family protein [Leptotrichia sp. OH3620_COT-345]
MDFLKTTASKLVQEIIKMGSSSSSGELTDDLLKKMLKDIDIRSALELMHESITSREWMIATDELEYEAQAKEIQKRFNNINMSKILDDMLKATVNKKSIFEISFQDMVVNDLILLPNKYISFDKDEGWKIKTKDSEIIIAKQSNKFLVCVNNGTLENMQGESDLEPLVKVFKSKENLDNKLNAIIEKYGDIITVFAYEPPLETATEEEKKKRYQSVEDQAKQLKEAKGKDVLAVPSSGQKSMDEFVKFIKLDDLKPEIYTELQKEKEKAIQKYILGSTLVTGVDGNSGNRALGEVHNEQKELKINAKIKKIRDWFQKIIEIDAQLYGYNSKNFYFKFIEELDEKGTLELEEKKAEILSKKMDSISKLSTAGYSLTKEKLAEFLGMETTDLIEITNSNTTVQNNPVSGDFEFAKKNDIYKKREKIEKNMKDFDNFINDTFDKYQRKVIKAVKVALSKVKNIDDFFEMKFDYDNYLEEMIIKAELIGFDNQASLDNAVTEFSYFSNGIKGKTKNDTLDFFLKKYPALHEDVEGITEYARHKNFWMKPITDINITEKFLNNLIKNIENGGNFEDWLKDSEKIIEEAGLKTKEGYLKTVYRTNMSHAYNAGIYKRQEKMKDLFPYYQYSGTIDGREQEHTRKLDGKIFKFGSPEGDLYYPPNGYNCRCYTISLSSAEIKGKEIVSGNIEGLESKNFSGSVGNEKYIRELEEKYQIKAKDFNSLKGKKKLLNNAFFSRKGKYKNALDIVNLYSIIDVQDITYQEHKAILSYSGDSYTDINEVLLSGKINEKLQKEIDLISSAINKNEIKENIQVFRGVSGKHTEQLILIGEKLIGKTIPNNCFLSTSLSFDVAKSFAKETGVVFNIKVPKGKKAFFLSQQDAYYSPELEILFDKKTNIKIEKVYKKGKLTIIEGSLQ